MRTVNPTVKERWGGFRKNLRGRVVPLVVVSVIIVLPILLSLLGMQSRYWLVTTGIVLAGLLLAGIWLLRLLNKDDEDVADPNAGLLFGALFLLVVGTSVIGNGVVWLSEILWPPGPSKEEQKVVEDREAALRQARIAELQRLVDIAPLKAEEETEDALGCTPKVQIPIPADAEVRVWMRANCDLGIKFIRSLGATYTVTQYVGPDYSPNFTQVFGPDEIMDFQAFPYVRAKYYLVAAGPDTSGLIEVYRCLEHAACPALRTN